MSAISEKQIYKPEFFSVKLIMAAFIKSFLSVISVVHSFQFQVEAG